ncbi:MAG: fused MFS/spermidine synthase [Myxococcota bacterium]
MRIAAFAAFFLSGASSLIFQNLWARMLHHVFGATGVAISTVVSVFMAGLGLGAWVAGRYADRMRRPLLAYAAAEVAIGLWALLIPWLVDPEGWLAQVNRWLRLELGAQSLGFMLGRFACVVPILLVPTVLMGASLPLLARHFVRGDQRAGAVGSSVGALYAVNTLGAVAGVFLAAFVLMPTIGLSATNGVAVAINLALGAGIVTASHVAGRLRAQRAEQAPERAIEAPGPVDAGDAISPAARMAALIAFGVSGAAALAYEVAWTRALAMTIGASVHSFALILVTFLMGIAGGSAVAAAVLWGRGRLRTAMAVAASGLSLLASAPWALQEGPLAWALASLMIAAPAWLIWWVVTARSRTVGLAGLAPGPAYPALLMLAIPALASIAHAVTFGGTLPGIVAAVTCTVAAFCAVLVLFREAPILQLGMIQLFVAGATFVNYLFQDEIPCAFAQMVQTLPGTADHVGTVQFFMFLTAGLCTLPATLGMGAMFPLTLRVWTASGAVVARDVGTVYASNTAGSIVGAWLPGFVLMPLVGLERTLHVGIWTNLALALWLVLAGAPRASDRPRTPFWRVSTVNVLAVALPLLAALLYLVTARPGLPLRWNLTQMTLGVFRISKLGDACDEEAREDTELVYYDDGLVTTVSVERWGRHVVLRNNGKVEASNAGDMPTQIMVSAYPLLLHPAGPQDLDVAVIGFGSGVSVGSALQFPVDRVDVVELERSVVDASRWFAEVNHLDYGRERFPYVTNDRLRVHNDDGRNFLASVDRKYDVIISEPSNPWITGVSDLFTTDHFRISRRRLAEGGIYCQWVQLYELSPRNIKTIMRTFATHFDHVVVFSASDVSSDTILLGSDSPIDLDLERVASAMNDPRVAEELDRASVRAPQDALAQTLLASREEVMSYTRIEQRREGETWVDHPASANGPDDPCAEGCRRVPAPLNTDDNARIEFSAPRDLIGYERYDGYLKTIYSDDWPYGRLLGRVKGMPEAPGRRAAEHARLALALAAAGRSQRALQLGEVAQAMGPSPEAARAARLLHLLLGDAPPPAPRFEAPVPGPQLRRAQERDLQTTFELIREAMREGKHGAALALLEAVPAPHRIYSGASFRFLHGYLLHATGDEQSGRYRRAAHELEELVHAEERWAAAHPEVFYYLARAQHADLQFDRAVHNMGRYLDGIGAREAASAN